jgi:serine/threonine-protein kinase
MVVCDRMNAARSYRIAELLGRGSFGSVYRADSIGTGIQRPVAIKVLRPEAVSVPGLLERLRDEARMLSLIRHRAIVRVDDLLELDGNWSVVMEYIEGCDVAALLDAGPLPPRVALAIAEEVANALHVANVQEGPDGRPIRLVHRDVKPGNIRVTAQGEVKLLDFGVARAEFSSREIQGTNAVFGTPTYMAPERYRGDDTHAGDVYALGVSLFEMLAGEPPGTSPMEPERVPPGLRLAPAWRQIRELSLPLRDLICAMLAHDPAERPPARDCARALQRIRGQLGGMTLEDWAERVVPPALRARRGTRDGRVGTVMAERSSQPSLRASPPRRRTGMGAIVAAVGGVSLLGLLAVVVIGTGVGAWWWSTRPSPPTEAPQTASTGERDADAAPTDVGVAPTPTPSPPAPRTQEEGTPVEASPPPAPAAPAAPEPPPALAAAPESTPASSPVSSPAAPQRTVREPAPTSSASSGTSKTATRANPGKSSGTTSSSPVATEPAPPVPAASRGLQTGIVALEGKAESVILMGQAGVRGAGEVPAGVYAAEIAIGGEEPYTLRDVAVKPGRVTTISCDSRYCRASTE